MENKTKIIIAVCALATAFAIGRYTVPEKVRIETKIVEIEKKVTDQDKDKNEHKKTIIVVVTKPDGTKQSTTTISDDTDTKTDTHQTDDISKTTDITKEITAGTQKTTVLGLVGMDLTKAGLPDYGISVSKSVLGPVSVGVFGFKSGMVGAGVGLSF